MKRGKVQCEHEVVPVDYEIQTAGESQTIEYLAIHLQTESGPLAVGSSGEYDCAKLA